MPYLACSARAFSLVKQPIKGVSEDLPAYDTPLWHNGLFRNEHKQAYVCSKFIRMKVLTVGALPLIAHRLKLRDHKSPLSTPSHLLCVRYSNSIKLWHPRCLFSLH